MLVNKLDLERVEDLGSDNTKVYESMGQGTKLVRGKSSCGWWLQGALLLAGKVNMVAAATTTTCPSQSGHRNYSSGVTQYFS